MPTFDRTVREFMDRRVAAKLAVARSHGLTALAQLARDGGPDEKEKAIASSVEVLRGSRNVAGQTYVSAVIALGELLQARHVDEIELLIDHVKKPRDSLVPRFAMIALGKIGGEKARDCLSKTFRSRNRGLRPWAALGLGLLAHRDKASKPQAKGRTRAERPSWRREVGEWLIEGLDEDNTDDLRAAVAIGLGLAGVTSAAPRIHEMLTETKSEEYKGYLCVALALLGDRRGIEIAQRAIDTKHNPEFLGHAAMALGKLGSRTASSNAVVRLRDMRAGPNAATWMAAAAQAVGYLKNGKDVDQLVEMLPVDAASSRRNRSGGLRDLRAAFAAAALGSIADQDPLGFGARVAYGMNYTVRVQTVSNGKTGVLDIF